MPHARVILRLETKEKSSYNIDISYKAPDLIDKEKEKLNFEVNFEKEPISSLEEINILKGRREYHKIVVETYLMDMLETSEQESDVLSRSTTPSFSPTTAKTPPPPPSSSSPTQSPSQTTSHHTSDSIPANYHKPTFKDVVVSSSSKLIKNEFKSKSNTECIGVTDDFNSSMKSSISNSKSQIVRFFSGNPAVETLEGFLHLYKEVYDDSDSLPSSHMISIICISATYSLQDLLQFLRPISNDLELIRIVKPASPNEYMALLKFRSMDSAHEFYKTYNNTQFNSIEPDICHLVFVARIECISSENGAGKPIPNAVELPVCAVCLEKMDESVEGILTILCNHSFHAPCMAQCEDTTCPVCRYIQTPMPVAGNKCIQCSVHEDLWICLICGEVGCGRYANGHAYGHFKDTAHTYAMQLGSNRVWDYVGENYVHRLVLNKMDGKLVEVDNRNDLNDGMSLHQEEKIESLSLEYTYLLTSQLESQREYFEKKMMCLESQKSKELEEVEIQYDKMRNECDEKNHIIANFSKDKISLEKKCTLLNAKTAKLQSDLNEEREMNRCLRENQQVWQTKVTSLESKLLEKDNEIKELQDQLRDIMFYLDAKDKLKEAKDVTQEEIAQGQISVQSVESGEQQHRGAAGGGGRKTRKKK